MMLFSKSNALIVALAFLGLAEALVDEQSSAVGNGAVNDAQRIPFIDNDNTKKTEFDEFDAEFLDDEEDVEDEFFSFFRSNKQGRRRNQESSSQRVNIFQKLRESLGTTIVGCLLIALMPCLIWKNEGRHVDELSRIDFCKNNAVEVDCNTATGENVGRLVHFNGKVTVGEKHLDFGESDGMNVSKPIPNALVLKRTCYIWQKFEVATNSTQRDMVGGGETRTVTYNLKEDWTAMGPQKDCPHLNETNTRGTWDRILAATGGAEGPAEPEIDMQNPQQAQQAKMGAMMQQQQQGPMPLEMAQAFGLYNSNQPPQAMKLSDAARVGEFYLSEKVMLGNPAVFTSETKPILNAYVPELIPGCEFLLKGTDNVLRTFEEGQQPQNGDCKVVYEFVPAEFDASFVVSQTAAVPEDAKEEGVKYGVDEHDVQGRCNKDLGQIWMVRKGTFNLYEMLDMAKQDENKMTMIIRVVGWVLLCAGWVMLFSPFLTVLQVLPLLSQLGYFAVVLTGLVVSCVCCLTIMSLAYLRYRPVITGGALILSLGIWGIVAWRLNVAAENGGDTPAPTPAPAIF